MKGKLVVKMIKRAVAVGVVVSAVGSLAACGGGVPNDAVAVVGGTPISKATLDHWLGIQFRTNYQTDPQKPVPRGVVPDPPQYIACAAYSAEGGGSVSQPAVAQLKRRCEENYRSVREHVLNVLIVFEWYIHEGARNHLRLTDAEVRRESNRYLHERFPKAYELERYRANTGETVSDEMMRMRIDLIGTKLNEKEIAKLGGLGTQEQQHSFVQWGSKMPKRWALRTDCKAGYIVPNCKQYKGPLSPDARI